MTKFDELPRLDFQDQFRITKVGEGQTNHPPVKTHTFISRTPAWLPGANLPFGDLPEELTSQYTERQGPRGTFGAHIYVQSSLAAARVLEEEDEKSGSSQERRHISSIQGSWTQSGYGDRPFVLDVQEVSTTRSYATCIVNARQPTTPSSSPEGPFPTSDATKPLGNVCFTSTTTFKRPLKHPHSYQADLSSSPFHRFRDVLSSRKPDQWPQAPHVDLDILKFAFPDHGHGDFPLLDMHKVDLQDFNAGRPYPEKRELIYYRLAHPLPREDVNAHILCHAFESDRNGLIMLANHLGYGFRVSIVASLSCSFFLHVNGDEAVIDYDAQRGSEDGGWWLQEVSFPRLSAGRAMMEVRLWSPDGRHVASAYQDGVLLPKEKGLEKL